MKGLLHPKDATGFGFNKIIVIDYGLNFTLYESIVQFSLESKTKLFN